MPFIKQVAIFAKKGGGIDTTPRPIIAAGRVHSLLIKTTGRGFAWGNNSPYGELGDGTTTARATPVSIAGAVKTFCKIDGGVSFSLAIDKNGKAWAWGHNGRGNLGNNSTTGYCTPIAVLGATKTFCEISAGGEHSLAIDKNGRAWGWGYNLLNQLGDNTTTQRNTPVSVAGATKTFCQISAGGYHSLALDKNGRAWGWGYNSIGQLGDNSTTQKPTPVSIAGTVKTFCKIFANVNQVGSSFHSVAIDKNGRAWAWGFNNSGQLGNNSTISQRTPVSILGATKTFCEISAGSDFSVGIDKNGIVWSWGVNNVGQLGDNTLISKRTPVSLAGVKKTFCRIHAGNFHSLAVDKSGNVWAWGQDAFLQLGVNMVQSIRTPVSVLGTVRTFCKIVAGSEASLAIDKNGRAWGWGTTTQGQLGDNNGDGIIRCTPISVCGVVKTFCQIFTSISDGRRSLALDKNGRVWGWGYNDLGQIGDFSVNQRNTPVSVAGATKTFCQISAGNRHSVAIEKNGRIWCWGNNAFGNLGNNASGTGTCQSTPVAIAGTTKTFCKIAAGQQHTIAIDKNGRAWGWGYNPYGELGDSSITNRSTPVALPVRIYCQIAAGGFFSLGIDSLGRAYAWGLNLSGQLGINSTTSQRAPTAVGGTVKTFCKISAGSGFSVAIDKNGRAWAWGNNGQGQLGDNTTTQRNTPVSVAGTVKTFCEIFCANAYTLAIDKNGRAWGWGLRFNGSLGDVFTTSVLTPVRVCTL
jgi:alpha-tubulin suppressor-like RCC1 family protein